MSTNLEVFEQWKQSSQERFDIWNDKQPETRKIHVRLPFSVRFPKIKFTDFDRKPYIDKKTGVSGTNVFKRMKISNSQGQDVAAKIQSPTVISPRGYTLLKTSKGEFKTILVVYDLENPDHEIFCNSIENDITLPAMHEILKTPGDFGIQESPFPVINETVLASKEYEMAIYGVKKTIAKILNFPKTAAGFDFRSPLRTVFLSPMFFQDPEKPDDPPSEMTVYIKIDATSPPFVITPDELMAICDGFKGVVDGKVIKGDKKGFECGPEINFQKLNAGSKPSTKISCSSITITRFQAAPKNNSQEEKIKYLDSIGASDEYSIQMGMDSLLAGLRGASIEAKSLTTSNIAGNTFDPMGGSSSSTPPEISNSLLSTLENVISNTITIPNEVVQQQLPPPVFTGVQQLPPPVFSGLQIPMTIQGLQMPMGTINSSAIDTSQQSFSDRLQMFNKQSTVGI